MAHDFQHKKSLGQNFLNSPVVPRWLCDAADLSAGETVLEIGPGSGALTRELLVRGARVVAVEADVRAIEMLQENFATELATGRLTLHYHDARELFPSDFGLTPRGYKVVANIPYYLSGYLLRQLLDTTHQPTTLVFLMQKELVERIARSKKESLLSLSVKAFGTPQYVKTVTRGHFTPSPKVDSAILAVRNISLDNFSHLDRQTFFALLHIGFGQKRKQLVSNLVGAGYDRDTCTYICTNLGLPPTVRAEDVSLKEWLLLSQQLTPTKYPD